MHSFCLINFSATFLADFQANLSWHQVKNNEIQAKTIKNKVHCFNYDPTFRSTLKLSEFVRKSNHTIQQQKF
jgi:hypothetical protein